MKLLLALLCLSLSAHAELRPGETELTLPNGAVYQGTVKDGKPDGMGYMRFKNGTQYEGEFKGGAMQGSGILVTSFGDRYEGQFDHGRFDGSGKMVYRLGGSYEGQWKKGAFHGKGVLTYAGAGRKAEGEFVQGVLAGSASSNPKPAEAVQSKAEYAVKDDHFKVGTHMLDKVVERAPYPQNKPYEEMSEDEKATVRRFYPALAPGDEPPFPSGGLKDILLKLKQAQQRVMDEGSLSLIVDVAADGKPTKVTMAGGGNADLARFAGTVFMQQQYKPAKCDGKPCAMAFYYGISFATRVQ